MKKIALDDIRSISEYETERQKRKEKMMRLKERRRIQIGERISIHLENRETLIHQIQEMTRIERTTQPSKIQEEVDVYNELIPGGDEVSTTLFVEVSDQSRIKEELLSLLGLDEPGVVYLEIGTQKVEGVFEKGRSTEEKISSVHYVRFPFSKGAKDALKRGEHSFVVVNHPHYKVRAPLSESAREEMLKDLEA